MADFPRLTPNNLTPSTANAPTVDGQTPSGHPGSRVSPSPRMSTLANPSSSAMPPRRSGIRPTNFAPQKPSPFDDLPPELTMSVFEALRGPARLDFAVTNSAVRGIFDKTFDLEQTVQKIREMPMNGINDLKVAWELAKRFNRNSRYEPMQAVAEKLIFLPRQDSQAGKEYFMREAESFISKGNEFIDKAIEFFDWSRSAPTIDQPNLLKIHIDRYRLVIDREIRFGLTAREAVESVVGSEGQVNSHDMDLCVQHARGLEVNGLPNVLYGRISHFKINISRLIGLGNTPENAVESTINRFGKVNSHDMDLCVQHAKGLETNDLPNLPSSRILTFKRRIVRFIKEKGDYPERAVKFTINRLGQVNSHDMELLMKYADNYKPRPKRTSV